MSARRWSALLLLFLLSLPAVTTRIYASDEIQYFAFVRSIYFDRDLSFDNEYRHYADQGMGSSGFRETFLTETTDTGRRKTFATIGAALMWLPFYAAGDLVARTLNAAGHPVAIDGYSTPYVAAVCYGSAAYGWLAVVVAWCQARRFATLATAAAVAVAIGTPLVFYSYLAPVFAHAASAFAVAAFIAVWLRVRRTWRPAEAAALGALGALVMMVREQDVAFVIVVGLDFLRHLRLKRAECPVARIVSTVMAGVVAFALAYLPQAWAYVSINGHLGPSNQVARKMSWTAPHALEVLFSLQHGFLFWTPVAVLAIAGLAWLFFRDPVAMSTRASIVDARWLAVSFLLMFALTVYMAGSVESWTVAGAFGQRRFTSLTTVLIIGLAVTFDTARRWSPGARATVAALAGLAIWWNLGMAAAFGLHRMDRQRLTLADNARTVFLELPRETPAIAWRYLFSRSSFYNLPRE